MAQTAWSIGTDAAPPEASVAVDNMLLVGVVGPDDRRRDVVATSIMAPWSSDVRHVSYYPEGGRLVELVNTGFDVIIVELDSDPERALQVVEQVARVSQSTVMVYSVNNDSDLMIRSMRAGAREFLSLPIAKTAMAEALARASARRANLHAPIKDGQLCMFWGAKGGSGVTMVATNFAIAAARESAQKVLLIDLDLPLGDAVLNLGLAPQYSTVDALQNYLRLDGNFLSKLLMKHEPSGIWVLAAPGRLIPVPFSSEAVDKLINVARAEFDVVVVDSGSRFDLTGTAVFDPKAHIYLVTQVSIPELRNTNRLAADFFGPQSPKFEVILNRWESSSLGLDEDHITKIITRKPQWKIPNDYGAVREMQNSATPIAMSESAISKVICQMARAACGLPDKPVKRKKLMSLF
ncbi:MAG: AAA family ATPase [Terracidiphilus sp.]